MKFGLTMFPTDYSIGPGELAAAIEERTFESFWVPEHSHFPVSPMTPGRDQPGLPPMYYDVVDPFIDPEPRDASLAKLDALAAQCGNAAE